MKNEIIYSLVQSGVINATANSVSASAAYALYKLKKNIIKAAQDLDERRKGLVEEQNIQELIDKKDLTEEEQERIRKADSLVRELFNDETEVDISPVSYDDWHAIVQENDKIFNYGVESALEGVFWKTPEE